MPCFAFISGYFMKLSLERHSIPEFVKGKLFMLIPVFVWANIIYILKLLLSNESIVSAFSISNCMINFLYSYWFIWSVVIGGIICVLIREFNSKFVLLLLLTFSLFTPDLYHSENYKFIAPYFVIGYYFNNFVFTKFRILLATILLYIMYLYYDIYIISGYSLVGKDIAHQIYLDTFRFIIGVIGIYFNFAIIFMFYKFVPQIIKSCLLKLGRETFSLSLYILQQMLIVFVIYRIPWNYEFNIINIMLYTIFVIGASYCISKFIKKYRYSRYLI